MLASLLIPVLLGAGAQPVYAACTDTYCTDCENPKVDLTCQRKRLVDPTDSCTLLYCGDSQAKPPELGSETVSFNFFGVTIRMNSSRQLETILYVIFTLFLGVVAIGTVAYGIYGAFKRAGAQSADDVASAVKIMQNALVGFLIAGLALLIAQLVASFIGVGSLTQVFDLSNIFTPY